MRSKRTNKAVRLNIETSEKTRKLLEELRTKTGAHSLTEVVCRALEVYEFFRLSDRNIFILDPKGKYRKLFVL
jgi:hypothetical protein